MPIDVTRKSQISGVVHTLSIDITQEQLDAYERGDILLQDAFPDLDKALREFIMTGITPEEWAQFVRGSQRRGARR